MKRKFFFAAYLLCAFGLSANNLKVTNASLTGQDAANDFTKVQFSISWDNSWRTSGGAANWDAAWVFVKYRANQGDWHHATLSTSAGDHTAPAGSTVAPAGDGKGVFIHRSADGSGTFSLSNIQLRWNYGTDGVQDNDQIEVKVFAIEMVYVPQGSFYAGGSGTEIGSFVDGAWRTDSVNGIPLLITSQAALTIDSVPGALWGKEADTTQITTIGPVGSTNANFPTGYNAFYCMKYEFTQRQFVEYFNTLTAAQKVDNDITRLSPIWWSKAADTLLNGNNVSIVNGVASLPGGLYADVPCGFMAWYERAAWLDWAALRPMTELEYEKARRGPNYPQANDALGGIAPSQVPLGVYTFLNEGLPNERIDGNYSAVYNVANFNNVGGHSNRPLRVGIFAADARNTGPLTANASYYGILDLVGNMVEDVVTVAKANGRKFTGNHGDGELTATGKCDEAGWPFYVASIGYVPIWLFPYSVQGTSGAGLGQRGTSFRGPITPTSARSLSGGSGALNIGTRGVRTAP